MLNSSFGWRMRSADVEGKLPANYRGKAEARRGLSAGFDSVAVEVFAGIADMSFRFESGMTTRLTLLSAGRRGSPQIVLGASIFRDAA
jgi:hypothetical protein